MEEARQFGDRLKELRLLARLTQRQLADLIGVDFSYLSKIENGVLPPPSERVLSQLAEALNTDKDELLILAGKIPADIAEMLKNRKTLELLRSRRTQKKIMAKNTDGIGLIKKARNLPRIPGVNLHGFARVALAIVLVIAVGSSLWFVSPQPVKAVDITYPSLPSSGTLGSAYTFTITVDIGSTDLLPVDHINLEIYKSSDPSTYKATLANLPLGNSSLQSHTISEGSSSGTVQVSAVATSWGYGTGSRTGYGYRDPAGWGYHTISGTTGGYGYGTSPFTGVAASITYTVKWVPPSNWPTGSYNVKALVYADSTNKFSGTSSAFTLSAVAAPAAPGGGVPPAPDVADLADVVDEDGVFTETVTVESSDGNVEIVIPSGTTGLTEDGEPLSEITVVRADPPAPPANTETIAVDYDLGPSGAIFDPPIFMTFHYNPDQIPAGGSHENLSIAYYDADSGQWVELDASDIEIDPVTNTITFRIGHFTYFSIIAHTAPAAFTVSNLTISPSAVDAAEMVTISVSVTNTGDLAGEFKATLKINGAAASTGKITLDGDATGAVTFTTAQGAAGTYTIDVHGLTGQFTVKAVTREAVITVPPWSLELPHAPSPDPRPPTASLQPPAPAPVPSVSWWLLGAIALATIIVVGLVLWLVAFRRE